jgi:hypothetical protein
LEVKADLLSALRNSDTAAPSTLVRTPTPEVSSPALAATAGELDAPAARAATVERPAGLTLSDEVIQDIRNMPHGSRPDPRTYTAPEAIAEHLGHFDEGAARFMTETNLQKYGIGQRDGTAFVVPAAEANALEAAAAGSATKLEKALGLPDGLLQNNNLVRVDIPKPRELDLRMPSGNEAGANSQWIPGGRLPGGGREAVISVGRLQPGQYSTRVVAGGGVNPQIGNTVGGVEALRGLGGKDGHGFAGSVTPGGSAKAFAGHGVMNGMDTLSGHGQFVSPGGTTVVMPRPGITIADSTGRILENVGSVHELKQAIATGVGPNGQMLTPRNLRDLQNFQVVGPGQAGPNLTLLDPGFQGVKLNIMQNSTTTLAPTRLSELLELDMGCVFWAACTQPVPYIPKVGQR